MIGGWPLRLQACRAKRLVRKGGPLADRLQLSQVFDASDCSMAGREIHPGLREYSHAHVSCDFASPERRMAKPNCADALVGTTARLA